jgi:hypothetical protein
MSQIALTVTTFVNPDGSPVANGYIRIRLSQDGSVNNTQIQSSFTKIALDSNGTIVGSPVFWPNDQISPSGTYYIIIVYAASGQEVARAAIVTLSTPAPTGFGEAFGSSFGS